MGVEILILSGSRQGERVLSDANEIRAGGSDACDVFFDPAADATARGRIALFRRNDEGWSIQNAGTGELMLNQEIVSDRTRIRSGDIVRLSDRGPDFSFEILSGQASFWAESPAEKARPKKPPVAVAQAASEQPPPEITAEDVLQTGVAAESTLPPITHPASGRNRNILVAAVSGCAALTVLMFLAAGLFRSGEEDPGPVAGTNNTAVESGKQLEEQSTETKTEQPKSATDSEKTSTPTKTPEAPTPPTDPVAPKTTPAQTPKEIKPAPVAPPADDWPQIESKYQKTVWLLRVADPTGKFVYPFATAVAVDRRTLLTTATVAAELQKFTDLGWTVRAGNAALKKTASLSEIRLHALYADFADDPQKKIYVDLGVLTTSRPLPVVAPLAEDAELTQVDTGTRLACIGISHQGDAIKADDDKTLGELAPKLIGCKLFLRTQFDPKSPSSPRLLHLKPLPSGDLSGNLYGSPIVDRQGKIVAIYAEPATLGEGKQLRLHYAIMIEPAIIKSATGQQSPGGAKLWVPPPDTAKQGPARK